MYPSKVHRYEPLSLCTLQTCASSAAAPVSSCRCAPAVADVPSAIAATRQTNAQAKRKELIMLLTNFVFMIVFFLVLAFRNFSW